VRSTRFPPPDHPLYPRLRDQVLSYLWRRDPQHCVVLTDPLSRRAIDVGVARAARHGFRDLAEVRSFVGLMVFLGGQFDEDPQLPWAADHLHATAGASRAEAMAGLVGETVLRMEAIVGRSGEYYRRALAWSSARSFAELTADHDDSDAGLRRLLSHMHLRKYNALDDDAIAQLIDTARATVQRHVLTAPATMVVYLGLAFLLGSGLDRDPFHPWAGEALAAEAAGHAEPQGALLHARAIDTLRRYTRLDGLMRAQAQGG
jgi:hypothetical protein